MSDSALDLRDTSLENQGSTSQESSERQYALPRLNPPDRITHMDSYSHTQSGKLHYVVIAVALAQFLVALLMIDEPIVASMVFAIGLLILLLSFMLQTLTVSDEGDRLKVQYGPLRMIHKRFRYTDISSAKAARSKVIDGWGIHTFPGRGTTFNLWGFDCVEMTVAGRTIRIGTDDPQGLAEFLKTKIP